MTEYFITHETPIDDAVLNTIAHIPTEHLPKLVAPAFFQKLADKDFMRIGTLLAQKSFDEGCCPIGGVIIDGKRQISGKGHNTLGQENDSTTHGETAALRDAGRDWAWCQREGRIGEWPHALAVRAAQRLGKTVGFRRGWHHYHTHE